MRTSRLPAALPQREQQLLPRGPPARHNVDDSQAAEDAAKEAARKRPGHEVLGTLKSHGRKGSERASGDEHVRV